MFPLGCVEDKCLVTLGDFTGDGRSIHGTRFDFRCSEDEESLFKVIDDTFMASEAILLG